MDYPLGVEVSQGAEDAEGPTTEKRFFENEVVVFVVGDFFGKIGAVMFRDDQKTAMFSFHNVNVFTKVIDLGIQLL